MSVSLNTTVCSGTANSYADLTAAEDYFGGDHALASIWTGLSDDEKGRLLISASRVIDRNQWRGMALTSLFESSLALTQALAFPRNDQEYRSGYADSGSLTTLVDSTLADHDYWPDDYFQEGSVLLASGSNRGLIREIEGFISATGSLTLAAFPEAPAPGDKYFLIWPLEKRIVRACLEQAAHLYQAGSPSLADMGTAGVTAVSVDGLSLKFAGKAGSELCARARSLLSGYRVSGPRLGRS